MAITPDRNCEIFKGLENGDGAEFFTHVADDVDWIVEGEFAIRLPVITTAKLIFWPTLSKKSAESLAARHAAPRRERVGKRGLGGSGVAPPRHREEWP